MTLISTWNQATSATATPVTYTVTTIDTSEHPGKKRKMSKKKLLNQIAELQEELEAVEYDRDDAYSVLEVQRRLQAEAQEELRGLREQQPKEKFKHAFSVSFDLWPAGDWKRFSYSSYKPGKYWQLCLSFLRIDFFAD